MFKHVMQFLKDEEGASAVEYGLVVGLIAVALVAIMAVFAPAGGGGALGGAFQAISSRLPGSGG